MGLMSFRSEDQSVMLELPMNPTAFSDSGRLLTDGGTRLELGGTSLPLHGLDFASTGLSAHTGRELVLGMRPEDLQPARSQPDGPVIAARLELIEPVGHEVFLHLRYASEEVVARVAPDPRTEMQLAVPLNQLHFFDRATDERIEQRSTRGKQLPGDG